MSFFKGRILNLEDIITLTLEGKGPSQFSFLGIIDTQTHEKHDLHEFRVNHEIVLHSGTKCRLHIQYSTGFDDENRYDPRILDDEACPFYPKGSLCFFPMLETLYAEEDKVFCQFKGGDTTFGKYKKNRRGVSNDIEQIGPNRVCLLLDVQPSSIEAFLNSKEVRFIFSLYIGALKYLYIIV